MAQAANGLFEDAIFSNEKSLTLTDDEDFIQAIKKENALYRDGKRYFLKDPSVDESQEDQ